MTSSSSPSSLHLVSGSSSNPARVPPLHQVVAALGAAIRSPHAADLGAVFETALVQAYGFRSARLREVPASAQARLVTPARTVDSLVLEVPAHGPRSQAVLDLAFDPRHAPNDEGMASLLSLAQIAGQVLEAKRERPAGQDVVGATGHPLIGASRAMQTLREQIARVAATDFTVLIQGESGTGKELVARQVHELSRRRRGPFVAVNCAAIVETLLEAELFGIEDRTATGVRGRRGKFEHADGGTLFLDEIGDLSLSAQAKLLRVMQDLSVEKVGTTGTRRVDVRVVAATNRPLVDMASTGQFRPDLYYRLGGVDLHVPPLRARRDDIAELMAHFLDRHRGRKPPEISPAALDALQLYAWPGNVRELERLIERALALTTTGRIDLDDLPPHVRGEYADVLAPALSAGDTMRAWGSRYARLVYERCGGNKRRTCQLLDISYHTLKAYLRYARPSGAVTNDASLPAWVRSVSAGKP